MSKILVAFFSPDDAVRHSTRSVAEMIVEVTSADVYEIQPAVHYTGIDLDWENQKSRTSIEMLDPHSRPELADKNADIANHDVIYLGFPIWWYVAPHIILTFLETYDFSGKTIITFATSGGSNFGDTLSHLKHSAPDAKFIQGRVFRGNISKDDVANWIKNLNI